jgi:hypothetical protein
MHKADGKVEQMLLVRVQQGVPGAGPVSKPAGSEKASNGTAPSERENDEPIKVNAPPEDDPNEN